MCQRMIDEEAARDVNALIRNAPAEAVGAADLLRLLAEGPRDERERWALVGVLAGYRARPRLEMLVRAGAVPPLKLARVVRSLVADGHLRRDSTGRSPGEWVQWTDERIRPIDTATARVGSPNKRRGRASADGVSDAQSTAERSRRYTKARRAEGAVRKSLWLTPEAAAALEELAGSSKSEVSTGAIVSDAILTLRQVRGS